LKKRINKKPKLSQRKENKESALKFKNFKALSLFHQSEKVLPFGKDLG